MNIKEDYTSYEIEEPSDEERAESSSEDELDVLLNGTPEQKKKLIREYLTGESESSSGDEFEKEMEAELSSTMKSMECKWTPTVPEDASGSSDHPTDSGTQPPPPPLYDQIYFDTDSEDEEQATGSSRAKKHRQRRIPTNDELLYDPDEDDRDQEWVDARIKGYRNSRKRPTASANQRGESHRLPSSDAVLNCPACMTTLCLDCQRHDKYMTQYRAMFVMNCTVNKEEVLKYKTLNDKRLKNRLNKKSRKDLAPAITEAADSGTVAMDQELYYPVHCTECSTEVAVFDKDEVYHFFNILASHS